MHRVILVRPRYSFNVGMAARVMKNFGFKDLAFVGRAKKTFTAKMFAKHSEEVLGKSKTYSTLEEAAEGFDVLVGTTGVLGRFRKSLKTCISLDQLSSKLKNLKAAIAFGGEDVGLNEHELNSCDWIVHIPTAREHSVLNLSHAVAVTLYAIQSRKDEPLYRLAPLRTRKVLEKKFARLVLDAEKVRNKKKVSLAFHRLLSRALPSEDEAQAVMAALAGFEHEMRKNKAGAERFRL